MNREPKNVPERQLLDYVNMFRNFREANGQRPHGFVYSCREAFLLEHGEWFEPRPLPERIQRRQMRACFYNSLMHAKLTGDAYVEGIAVAMVSDELFLPTEHAWNVTPTGLLIDTTWDHGMAYFGVPFPVSMATRALRGDCTVLDNYRNKYALYRKPFTQLERTTSL